MFKSSNSNHCFSSNESRENLPNNTTTYSEDGIRKSEDDIKIPKIIMQTWKTNEIPEKWEVSPKSIRKMMPDWKYVLMTDEDNRKFVRKHFPNFLPYYDDFPHNIQRADAIRYMWLYVHGGIYMDLDFEVLEPLDDLFSSNAEVYLINSSNVGSYITNSFMASKPRCKLWLEVIEAMKETLSFFYLGKHMEVMNSTGPMMLTHVIKESTVVYSMLPGKLMLPCSICNIHCRSKGSYLKQLEGSSWITYDTKIYNFFMCNWKPLLIAIGLMLFVIFIALLLNYFDFV